MREYNKFKDLSAVSQWEAKTVTSVGTYRVGQEHSDQNTDGQEVEQAVRSVQQPKLPTVDKKGQQ
jgi:hypothetical protein